jgi:hypothetical protein
MPANIVHDVRSQDVGEEEGIRCWVKKEYLITLYVLTGHGAYMNSTMF